MIAKVTVGGGRLSAACSLGNTGRLQRRCVLARCVTESATYCTTIASAVLVGLAFDASRPAARSEAIVVQHPTCTMQRNVYHSKLCGALRACRGGLALALALTHMPDWSSAIPARANDCPRLPRMRARVCRMVRVCLLHLAHALHTAQELLGYLEGVLPGRGRGQHTTANEQLSYTLRRTIRHGPMQHAACTGLRPKPTDRKHKALVRHSRRSGRSCRPQCIVAQQPLPACAPPPKPT